MSLALLAAANHLAQVIVRENAALQALDMAAAGQLLPEKNTALAAFVASHEAEPPFTAAPGSAYEETQAMIARLRQLAEENRVLLRRAIAVQARLIAIVARAAHTTRAAPGYGARGRPAERPAAGVALSARA